MKLTPVPISGCPVSRTSASQVNSKDAFSYTVIDRSLSLTTGGANTRRYDSLEPSILLLPSCASKWQDIEPERKSNKSYVKMDYGLGQSHDHRSVTIAWQIVRNNTLTLLSICPNIKSVLVWLQACYIP